MENNVRNWTHFDQLKKDGKLPIKMPKKPDSKYAGKGCTMHSFRHSMRDRLRAVQCPSDVADQIGGWATDGVGQGYGSGYPIEVLMEWVKKW